MGPGPEAGSPAHAMGAGSADSRLRRGGGQSRLASSSARICASSFSESSAEGPGSRGSFPSAPAISRSCAPAVTASWRKRRRRRSRRLRLSSSAITRNRSAWRAMCSSLEIFLSMDPESYMRITFPFPDRNRKPRFAGNIAAEVWRACATRRWHSCHNCATGRLPASQETRRRREAAPSPPLPETEAGAAIAPAPYRHPFTCLRE